MSKDKDRSPDYKVQLLVKDSKGVERSYDHGVAWDAKHGYIAGETPQGRLLLTPRQELNRMRAGRSQEQSQSQQQSQDIEH